MTMTIDIFNSPDDTEPCAVHGVVIDASQSMSRRDWPPTRLEAALDAAVAYVDRLVDLGTDCILYLIVFSEHAYVITPPTAVTELKNAGLDNLRTEWANACERFGGRNTNIGDALFEAATLLLEHEGPAQVVLLTDGEHNCGRDPRTVAPQLKRLATVVSVGIGGALPEVDETLLREISSRDAAGATLYRWIGERGRLVKHFEALAGRICRS
jgi:Mg-chelatase subunit ChlD